jgi:hypothetical protein
VDGDRRAALHLPFLGCLTTRHERVIHDDALFRQDVERELFQVGRLVGFDRCGAEEEEEPPVVLDAELNRILSDGTDSFVVRASVSAVLRSPGGSAL